MPTLKELVDTYKSWKLRCPPEDELKKLSTSKAAIWKTKYISDWKKAYPWLIEANVHGAVVGVLCSVCRDHTNDSLSNLQPQINHGNFITQSLVRFGDLVETARSHEFGNKADRTISPCILQKQIEEGRTIVPNTTYMTFYLQEITKKLYEKNDATIDNTMKNTHLFVVEENY